MSSRSKPFNSWLHRGWGLGLWPRLSDHLGRGAWKRELPAQFPIPPHSALALHTSPPVNVASLHHHRLPQLMLGPGLVPGGGQLGGPSSKPGSWNQGGSPPGSHGKGLIYILSLSLFFF